MKFTKIKISGLDFKIGRKTFRLRYISGMRPKYIGHNFVIKMDNDGHTVNEIKLLKKISKEDRKYFPKIFKYRKLSQYDGYIIQERIKFRKGKMALHNRNIVIKLIEKYNLDDVDCDDFGHFNCGTRSNGMPVIFDFGY